MMKHLLIGMGLGAADIELAVGSERKIDRGIAHDAAHIALAVRDCDDAADWTAALHADGERGVFLLHELTQHGRGTQRAAERGGGCGREMVNILRALHGAARSDDLHFDKAVCRDGTDDFVHDWMLPFQK